MNKTSLNKLSKSELIETFVEVQITGSDDFLKIRETLTRMGVSNRKTKSLYQSCHILHKRINGDSKYFIVHFKELFALDSRVVEVGDDDYARRNTIANTLQEWGMCSILDKSKTVTPVLGETDELHRNMLTIISHADKKNWTLQPKYKIGNKKNAA